MSLIDVLLARADGMARRRVREDRTVWRFATVTSVSPLRIRFEGEDDPRSSAPVCCSPVVVGDFVRAATYKNQTTIWKVFQS